jgi:hypothetical protein
LANCPPQLGQIALAWIVLICASWLIFIAFDAGRFLQMKFLANLLLTSAVGFLPCMDARSSESDASQTTNAAVYSRPLPKLAILDAELEGDLEDTSRVADWDRRLAALNSYLRRELDARNLYIVLSSEPAADLIERDRARRGVHDCVPCIQDVAQRLGAERVLLVWIQRESALVLWLSARVIDPATGNFVLTRSMTFRGDNDRAWNKAADFFLRQLAEVPVERR